MDKMYNIPNWSEKYKAPMTKDYHKSADQFAGNQYGKTLSYIERQDKMQKKAAGKIKNQNYKGRYE